MKKIFEKLRQKLIKKLGGYVYDPKIHDVPLEITYYHKHFARISADWDCRNDLGVEFYKEHKDYVQKELAYKLADQMLKDNIISFIEFGDFDRNITKVDAQIEVCVPGYKMKEVKNE